MIGGSIVGATMRRFARSGMPALLVAIAMLATMMGVTSSPASAGQVGIVNTQGAELFVHPSDLTVIDYMDVDSPVDVLFGPYEGMYQIRYYGTDGWIWADYLNVDGAGAAVGGATSEVPEAAPASQAEEQWIDVNRTSGLVSLMVGDSAINSFWGSMGYDTSADGFYSTAVGTYYVYAKDAPLHYTDFAKNYISDWVAFDPVRYNGFHSYTKDKHGDIISNGAGLTGGCVALAPGDIDALFDFAQIGMRVEIHF